ncbi:MAG: dual specificity protein phosphatase 23 [Candidatus Nitrosopolaris sp.]
MTILGDNYRWIHGYIIRRPTNFSWVIKDKLAGSGRPMTYRQFLWLVAQGIDSIITVREGPLSSDWFINTNIAANLNDNVHLNVKDYGVPSLEQLYNTIDFMKKQIDKGKRVLVHCAAGKGRTGTILAAYLLKEENLTAPQAISKIRKLRPGSIQTKTQEKCVEAFEHYLRRSPKVHK